MDKVILFVHGLSGSSEGTWGAMIELFRRDRCFSEFALDTYEYPTSKIRFALGRKMPGIQDLALGLASYIHAYHSDKKEIVLVGHSLGGLVLRYYILNEFKINNNTPIVAAAMIATPHTGSALARIGSSFSWGHAHLKQLAKGGDLLRSILDDWGMLKIEKKIKTLYVSGGIDSVVDRESSMPYHGMSNFENLIKYGHVQVIKPEHENDIRFLTLKKFVVGSLPVGASRVTQELTTPVGSPLFYRYETQNEPYYLVRDCDEDLYKGLSGSNLWLSGPPGTGKTVSVTRALVLNDWLIFYFTLDGFIGLTAHQLLREICRYLLDRVGLDDSDLKNDCSLPEILRHFTRAFATQSNKSEIAIFIEEIPINSESEYSKFMELAYHLSMLREQGGFSCKLLWVFTSLVDPEEYLNEKREKIRERFEFLRLASWTDGEMRLLIEKLKGPLGLSFSESEISQIVIAAKGSPRVLKMFLKAVNTEVGKAKSIHELLTAATLDNRA
jgi:hypothetical protein